MPIEWTTDLATGVDEIDNQHKELFQRINNLLDACNHGKGKAEVKKVIWFLEDYVITHFSEEEKYMGKHDYPDYISHKKQHLEFIENFNSLKKQFEAEGPGIHIVVITNNLIVDWLKKHIRVLDKALGSFLKTRIR